MESAGQPQASRRHAECWQALLNVPTTRRVSEGEAERHRLTSSMRSGGTVSRSQPSMLPLWCSLRNTARKGVTRSLMPCTYPLAGCLHAAAKYHQGMILVRSHRPVRRLSSLVQTDSTCIRTSTEALTTYGSFRSAYLC